MSYKSFELSWLGKRVDYDKAFGYQCVDLIKQYLATEYGLKPGSWGNAIDYWKYPNAQVLLRFDQVASSAAKAGDIVVFWGLPGNPYGHIGIATGGLTNTTVEILEQNGGTGGGSGTGADVIRKRYIGRSRVAGLLRPKVNATPSQPNVGTLPQSYVGKRVYLSANVATWRVYKPGTKIVAGTLLPKQNGGLDYLIRGIDSLPNRVLVNSAAFGNPVSLPVDSDATIK